MSSWMAKTEPGGAVSAIENLLPGGRPYLLTWRRKNVTISYDFSIHELPLHSDRKERTKWQETPDESETISPKAA